MGAFLLSVLALAGPSLDQERKEDAIKRADAYFQEARSLPPGRKRTELYKKAGRIYAQESALLNGQYIPRDIWELLWKYAQVLFETDLSRFKRFYDSFRVRGYAPKWDGPENGKSRWGYREKFEGLWKRAEPVLEILSKERAQRRQQDKKEPEPDKEPRIVYFSRATGQEPEDGQILLSVLGIREIVAFVGPLYDPDMERLWASGGDIWMACEDDAFDRSLKRTIPHFDTKACLPGEGISRDAFAELASEYFVLRRKDKRERTKLEFTDWKANCLKIVGDEAAHADKRLIAILWGAELYRYYDRAVSLGMGADWQRKVAEERLGLLEMGKKVEGGDRGLRLTLAYQRTKILSLLERKEEAKKALEKLLLDYEDLKEWPVSASARHTLKRLTEAGK